MGTARGRSSLWAKFVLLDRPTGRSGLELRLKGKVLSMAGREKRLRLVEIEGFLGESKVLRRQQKEFGIFCFQSRL